MPETLSLPQSEVENHHEEVDFSKVQINEIIAAHEAGKPVEFESFSPYISDYDMKHGEIWDDNLTNVDSVGVEVAKILREKFPNARMISLYDEYNTDLPNSTEWRGNPSWEATDMRGGKLRDEHGNYINAPQLELPADVKQNFKKEIEDLLRQKGVLKETDTEEKNFLLISESEKIQDAEILVQQLETAGYIRRDGEAIFFSNPQAENPEFQEIPLRTSNGRWLCEALDASTYINLENMDITHLVVLPKAFKPQQDKVWEILRVLGIEPTNYHNIFYDKSAKPEIVSQRIREMIEKNE